MTDARVLDQVFETIVNHRRALKKGKENENSRTVKLLQRGRTKIAQKFGEEAVELVIEAAQNNRRLAVEESGDMLYFLLVLWAEMKIDPEDVWKEMSIRHGMSESEERARRK